MGSNFRLHSRMKKILFWFGVCVMSLLVMVQPARAAFITNTFSCAAQYGSCPSGTLTATVLNNSCAAQKAAVWPSYNVTFYKYAAAGENAWACGVQGDSSAAMRSLAFSATQIGAPVCVAPATYNTTTGMCDAPACPAADSSAGAYWITAGTTPDSIYTAGNGSFCKAGCQTKSILTMPRPAGYPSSDGASKVAAGTKTYYSFREYVYTGVTCTGGDTLPVASAVPSADSCGVGQSIIQMGSQIRCLNPATGQFVDTNSASAVAAVKTLADAKVAAQIQAAASAVAAAGGSASDVAAAKTVAAGAAAVAAAAPTNNGFAPNDPMNAFCVDNPQASICKDQTAGAKTVGTAALSGLYTDGALIGSKTVSSVVGGFKTSVLASGIGSAAGGFFTVNQAAGTCPVWSADVPMFGTMTFDFYCQSTFQNLLPWIRAVFLLIFSVVAFRIAIL